MPQVWQMKKSDFIGNYPLEEMDSSIERRLSDKIDRTAEDCTWGDKRRVRAKDAEDEFDYFLVTLEEQPHDVLLVVQDVTTGEYTPAGGYVDNMLFIKQEHRGRHLAAEIVLAAADLREGKLDPDSYTAEGLKAHENAHRLAVQRAMRQGQKVRPEVMADYVIPMDDVKARLLARVGSKSNEPRMPPMPVIEQPEVGQMRLF